MKKFVSSFLVLWAVWIMLAGFETIELLIGAIVSALIALMIFRVVDFTLNAKTPLQVIKFIVIYIPLFIYKLVIANLQVAKIVLSPSLPIHPAFVKVKTDLKGDLGRLTLANSITLTPGTLSLDVKDDFVYIHWIDVAGVEEADYQQEICGSFEKVLGGIFK